MARLANKSRKSLQAIAASTGKSVESLAVHALKGYSVKKAGVKDHVRDVKSDRVYVSAKPLTRRPALVKISKSNSK